ncbi:hypothetical protein HK096_007401 [Nowakowskiella sp. JEL0078]|nr:hypothetical protein HK096_007401 [Nowakowskiella sp. JEL0078]
MPVVISSGIPGVIAYLNGIRIPDILSFKTLITKCFALIFSVSSGLPVGPTGPMIHVGAMLGSIITRQLHAVRKYIARQRKTTNHQPASFDAIERDFVAIGAGCGISAALSSPIGGILFVLEEVASYFELTMLKRLFFGSFAAYVVVQLYNVSQNTYTVISQRAGNLLCNHKRIAVVDAFLYALVGILGGLLGSAFNAGAAWMTKDPIPNPLPTKTQESETKQSDAESGLIVKPVEASSSKQTVYQIFVNSPNWWKVRNTVIFAICVSFIQIFLPHFFSCKPLDSHIFLKRPSMCFALSNERQMFEGTAYIAGKGINSTVFQFKDQCLAFSQYQSVESILENTKRDQLNDQQLGQLLEDSDRENAFGSSSDTTTTTPHVTMHKRSQHLVKRTLSELLGIVSRVQSKWDGWSSGTPGTEAVGFVLPIPIPGAYDICMTTTCDELKNSSLAANITSTTNGTNLQPLSGVPVTVNWAMQYTCPKGYYNPMASLILNPMSRAVRLLFLRGAPLILEFPVLITFFIVFFIIVVLNFSSFVPGGSILPQLILGATYGRMIGVFGVWIHEKICDDWIYLPSIALSKANSLEWAKKGGSCLTMCKSTPDPSRFALVGAASLWGGINRLTLFVAVAMTELTDDLGQIPAMIIGIFFAVLVGNRINKGK